MGYAMHPAELLGILRRRGVTVAQLAQEAGETLEAVTLRLQQSTIDDKTACKYMDALQDIKRKGVRNDFGRIRPSRRSGL